MANRQGRSSRDRGTGDTSTGNGQQANTSRRRRPANETGSNESRTVGTDGTPARWFGAGPDDRARFSWPPTWGANHQLGQITAPQDTGPALTNANAREQRQQSLRRPLPTLAPRPPGRGRAGGQGAERITWQSLEGLTEREPRGNEGASDAPRLNGVNGHESSGASSPTRRDDAAGGASRGGRGA